jgi:hypothetical protein
MKVLDLIIKQVYFDQIISGEKKVETREVKPTTEKKYVILDEEGAITDIIQYDAIRLYVGYNKDRDSALVEVTGAELIEIIDDNDEPIYYDYKGVQNQLVEIEYSLGKILEVKKK